MNTSYSMMCGPVDIHLLHVLCNRMFYVGHFKSSAHCTFSL